VSFSAAGEVIMVATPTTDLEGGFEVRGVPNGTFDVEVKHAHSISSRRLGLEFPPGGSAVSQHFGLLRAGDADNNNRVTSGDFTLIKASFGAVTDCALANPAVIPCADFDGNGRVSPSDFTLLKQNFGMAGPVATP
jgi:hypothetical protein